MYRMLIVDDERIIRETLSRHIDWAALDVQVKEKYLTRKAYL